jgi:hypothetical protein
MFSVAFDQGCIKAWLQGVASMGNYPETTRRGNFLQVLREENYNWGFGMSRNCSSKRHALASLTNQFG